MALALLRSDWVSGNLVFKERVAGNDGAIHFGIDDDGIDIKFFGATSGKAVLWDESADMWIMSGVYTEFTDTCDYFADFAATGAGGISLTADGMSQNPESVSEDAFLTVLVGASTYEIPLYLNT